MRALALVLAFFALSGCTAFLIFQPGSGVTSAFMDRWNCNPNLVALEIETAKAELPQGKHWIPRVGWTACKVMGRIGAPQDIDVQESASGHSASWWYRSGYESHLVSLEFLTDGPMAGQWVVDYVGW